MNRKSFLRYSAIAAAALSVYLLQFVSPMEVLSPERTAQAPAAGLSANAEPQQSTFETVGGRIANWIASVRGEPAKSATVLLAEPVTIIRGPAYAGTQLPKGTPVKLVASEGRFLRVRYNESVITIPRTAAVMGAYRIN